MSLKPKTSRRLLILASVVIAAAGGVGGLVAYRSWSNARFIQSQRGEGLRFHAEKDWRRAMGALSKYLDVHQNDVEALRAYAQAREGVEEPDAAHITQAIGVYQRVLALDPNDTATARHLLQLLPLAGMFPEARDLAGRLRPSDLQQATSEHAEVLRIEADARRAINPADPLVEALLRRVLTLDPADFAARVILTEHLRDRGRGPDAMDVAASVPDGASADGRARRRLLEALARRDEPGFAGGQEVFQALCDMTGLDATNAGRTREVRYERPLEPLRVARLFDGLGAHTHALAVLGAGLRQFPDEIVLQRTLARRTWMAGRPADVLALFPTVNASPGGTHTEVLIFRILALRDMGKLDEARALAQQLPERQGDFRARAWTRALGVLLASPEKSGAEQVVAFNDALRDAENDPVLQVLLGDAYDRQGRSDEARKAWDAASRSTMALGWTTPLLRQATQLMAQGQSQASLRFAQRAFAMDPRSAGAFVALFRAHVALLESGFDAQTDQAMMLSTANRIDREAALAPDDMGSQAFREALLPGRVLLTARQASPADAAALAREAIASMTPRGPGPAALAALVELSLSNGLGIEDELLARLEQTEPSSARGGFLRALTAHARGQTAEGLALLDAGSQGATGDARLAWQRARATFLDRVRDARAAQAWAELADAQPQSLGAQLDALNSPAVGRDVDLTKRLLERAGQLGNFTSENAPPALRLVRARALLGPGVTVERRTQASDLLRALVLQEPELLDARVLLIESLLTDRPEAGIAPQRPEAIAQLRTLIPLTPDAPGWSLRLAQLYRAEGDVAAARAEMERLLNTSPPPRVALGAVEQLVTMRELASATSALERLTPTLTGEDAVLGLLLRARLARASGDDARALALLRELADMPLSLDAGDRVGEVADTLATLRAVDDGRSLIERFATLGPPADTLAVLRARFEARHGDDAKARELLAQLVAQQPSNPEARLSQIALLIEQGRTDEARAAAEAAAQALPDDQRVQALRRQLAQPLPSLAGTQDLEALAATLDANPATRERARRVRAIDQARKLGRLEAGAQLAALREQLRTDPALLALLVRVLMAQDPPAVSAAIDVAGAGLRQHPDSVELAVAGFDAARQAGQWTRALEAAQAWMQLSSAPLAAAAVGEARLELRQYSEALAAVAPLVAGAQREPATGESARVLEVHGRALVRSGATQRAFDELGPLLKASPSLWASMWLRSIAEDLGSATDIERWLGPALESAPNPQSQALVAEALSQAARRLPAGAPALLERASTILRPLAAASDAPPAIVAALGGVRLQAGDAGEASSLFERVLSRDPKNVVALRGAAIIALPNDPARAVALAERARESVGTVQIDVQLLLAQAHAAHARKLSTSGDASAGAASWDKAAQAMAAVVARRPEDVAARLGLIDALSAQSKYAEVIPHYDAILGSPTLPAQLPRAVLENNLAYAIVRAGRGAGELDRARLLAQSAIRQQPLAAFYDTLGTIERARRDRDAAIAAFREAVRLDAQQWRAWMQLALLLREGDAPQQEEAKSIAQRVLREGDGRAFSGAELEQLRAVAGP